MQKMGQFIISIDYEFGWGFADHHIDEAVTSSIRKEVDITKRLLKLFELYRVPATWAVVGHLLEQQCTWEHALPHPEYKRPIRGSEKEDWFLQHPPEGVYEDVRWFDSERLIPQIKESSVLHEIASHSYAHIIYGDPQVDSKAVAVDLENVIRVHEDVAPQSFVFPRNREAHHALLATHGFLCYRGVPRYWYDALPGSMRRVGHLLDHFLPLTRTHRVVGGKSGLVNVPQSALLLGRWGLRSLVPSSLVAWKMKRGLQRAARTGEVFHLWFHPSNFWHATDTQFAILEAALKEACRLRERGELHIVTMRGAARLFKEEKEKL